MRPYETMIIFDPEVEESAITAVLDRAQEVVRSSGGTPGALDRWGRRTFAYELRHRREGYYVVAEFAADPKAMADLDRLLTLADEVMRHKIVRLPEGVAGRRRPPGLGTDAAGAPSDAPANARGSRSSASAATAARASGGRGAASRMSSGRGVASRGSSRRVEEGETSSGERAPSGETTSGRAAEGAEAEEDHG